MKKEKINCSKCGVFIHEEDLYGELPEAFKNHVICKNCLKEVI